MTRAVRVGLGAALLIGLTAAVAGAGRAERAPLHPLDTARSDYVEYCAGCHGIQGSSEPARIPRLADRIGYFLCLPDGRDYLIRLPNVAHAAISDPQELADMMNFIVFGLGRASVPSGAVPYSGAEVARLRAQALKTGTPLAAVRADLVERMIRQCGAPVEMRAQ